MKSRSPEGRPLDYFSVPLIAGGDQINYAVVAAIAIFGLAACDCGSEVTPVYPLVHIFCQMFCFS